MKTVSWMTSRLPSWGLLGFICIDLQTFSVSNHGQFPPVWECFPTPRCHLARVGNKQSERSSGFSFVPIKRVGGSAGALTVHVSNLRAEAERQWRRLQTTALGGEKESLWWETIPCCVCCFLFWVDPDARRSSLTAQSRACRGAPVR